MTEVMLVCSVLAGRLREHSIVEIVLWLALSCD